MQWDKLKRELERLGLRADDEIKIGADGRIYWRSEAGADWSSAPLPSGRATSVPPRCAPSPFPSASASSTREALGSGEPCCDVFPVLLGRVHPGTTARGKVAVPSFLVLIAAAKPFWARWRAISGPDWRFLPPSSIASLSALPRRFSCVGELSR
jgi:hypothetical protein